MEQMDIQEAAWRKKNCERHSGRGHSFNWFNGGRDRWDDPPADTKCNCCSARFGDVQLHDKCPGAWAQHRDRLAFTRALQSPGGHL